MAAKTLKGWKIVSDKKLRGAYGETDYDKKLIRINKAKHKDASIKRLVKNRDGSENMLTTILHEVNHVRHPTMGEKGVEKLARAMRSKMTPKQKQRVYYSVK